MSQELGKNGTRGEKKTGTMQREFGRQGKRYIYNMTLEELENDQEQGKAGRKEGGLGQKSKFGPTGEKGLGKSKSRRRVTMTDHREKPLHEKD